MNTSTHSLEAGSIRRLLFRYAAPSAISGMIGAIYNIVDQIFIGHIIGIEGNAATNVVFPLVTLTNAIGLMCGVGASSGFSLNLGKKNTEQAGHMIGSGLSIMAATGILLTLLVELFLEPLLHLCGATVQTLPLAYSYERIVGFGILCFILSTGGSAMIRADGSPGYALFSVLAGAILNIFLDAVFMIQLELGIIGAAWATLISQVISGLLVIAYFLFRFQSLPLRLRYLKLNAANALTVCKIGAGPFLNHISMSVVQLLLNHALVTYGAASVYGSDIPLAGAGIVTKVNSITSAIVIGIAQGAQPIISYNYGAKNYARVRRTGLCAIQSVLTISWLVCFCFQLFPRQITMLFGNSNEDLLAFTGSYFRIFLMLVGVSGLQITVGNFFTALGRPLISILISASRQMLAFPVFLTILPRCFGLNGVLASGPLSDGICALLACCLFFKEYQRLQQLEASAVS